MKGKKRISKSMLAIILLITIASLVCFNFISFVQKQMKLAPFEESEESRLKISELDLRVGENAIVTQSIITDIKTGNKPFDEDDVPGNDSSDGNNIVRSFDQISWTIENTMDSPVAQKGRSN